MKDQLISFETAKLAKEKGFFQNTKHWWRDQKTKILGDEAGIKELSMLFGNDEHDSSLSKNDYARPTQSLLQRWLMTEGRHFFVRLGRTRLGWYYDVINSWTGDTIIEYQIEQEMIGSHEQAFEEGLQEALKLIEL